MKIRMKLAFLEKRMKSILK